GNRRWARQHGHANPSIGHQYGAEHVDDLLAWCASIGIDYVTVFVASSDNLRKRESGEVSYLMELAESVIAERISAADNSWRLHPAGRLDLLPDSTRHALKLARDTTAERRAGLHLTIAIGYDGREEVVDALRALLDDAAETGESLTELAGALTPERI